MVHFNGFNSDQALHALMAEDFSFSEDWYYWNQNRLGSFIPLLGSIFTAIGFSPLGSMVVVQYLILSAIFTLLFVQLKSKWLFLPLLLFVFFPHSSFINQVIVGHPYLAQILFVTIVLAFVHYKKQINPRLYFFGLPFVCGLAVWSSEVSLGALIAFLIVYTAEVKEGFKRKNVGFSILGLTSVFGFIAYAKSLSYKTKNFDAQFINLTDLIEGLKKLFHYILETSSFSYNKLPNTYLFYALILLILLLGIYRKRIHINSKARFFLLSGVFSFLIIILSSWWGLADYPLRYFTFSFLQLLLFLLFLVDSKEGKSFLLKFSLNIVAICIAWSGLYLIKYFTLEVPNRATQKEMREIAKMGDFGIIGSYWNTYSIDALSNRIEATPPNGYAVRNKRGVPKVFNNDSIMIIRNDYLEYFPDTVVQFQHVLIKSSSIGKVGQLEYAFYKEK